MAVTWPTDELTCICVDSEDKNIQEIEFDEIANGDSGVDDGAVNENTANDLRT